MKYRYLFFISSVFFFSCENARKVYKPESATDYIHEVKAMESKTDKVGRHEIHHKHFNYRLTYLPSEAFTILQNKGVAQEALKKEMDANRHFQYFILNIGNENENMMNYLKKQYSEKGGDSLLKQINFGMQPLFTMEYKGASYPCIFCLPEQGGNISPYLKFYLVFDNPEKNRALKDDLQLNFNDRYLSGEKISFEYTLSDLEKFPLITNQ